MTPVRKSRAKLVQLTRHVNRWEYKISYHLACQLLSNISQSFSRYRAVIQDQSVVLDPAHYLTPLPGFSHYTVCLANTINAVEVYIYFIKI